MTQSAKPDTPLHGHTPGPWRAELIAHREGPYCGIYAPHHSGVSVRIASTSDSAVEWEANAAYIVHACNAYPELVEHLREDVRRLGSVFGDGTQDSPRIAAKRALLAKLGEGQP